MDYTETLNPSDGPDTFPGLLQHLECDDLSHHVELIDYVGSAATLSAHMRQALEEDPSTFSAELLQFVDKLEGMAARGWYNAIERLNNEEYYRQQFKEMLGILEEKDIHLQKLESIHRDCEAERYSNQQAWRQLKVDEMEIIELKKYIDVLEREKSEAMRGLGSMVTRMESLFDQFAQRRASNPPITTLPPPTPNTPSPTKSSHTAQAHSFTWQDLSFPFTTSPAEIEISAPDPTPSTHSSLLTEAGSLPIPNSTSYPPPLSLPTDEARKAEERKTTMLSDVENTLWIQESKDREYLARQPPCLASSSRTAQLTPSSAEHSASSPPLPSSSFSPAYIYIPLPRNFVIPRVQKTCASLVFPSVPAVFHFPGGATRDQVVELVRRAYGVEGGEEGEDANVIRVRTHELEWELKNAIRKVLGKVRWGLVGGNEWEGEGKGDTYIVSRRDCYFDGDGGGAGLGDRSGCGEGMGGDCEEQGLREDKWAEEYFEALELQDDDDDLEDMPRLRGGAPVVFQDSPSSLRSIHRQSMGTSRTLAYHCGITTPAPDQEDTPFAHPQAWIEQARVLQLQNAAHTRMIEHLQEIIQDVEETVIWQDEELARAHGLITDLKCKVRKQRDETLAAASLADRAKEESRLLQDLLDQIHSQLVRLNEELEDRESNVTSRHPSSPSSPCLFSAPVHRCNCTILRNHRVFGSSGHCSSDDTSWLCHDARLQVRQPCSTL